MQTLPKAPDKWFNEEIKRGGGIFDRRSFVVSMRHVKNFDTAIDIGAHVGTWSIPLAEKFKTVYAFEPEPLNAEYFRKNTAHLGNIIFYEQPAGNGMTVNLEPGPRNSGQFFCTPGNKYKAVCLDEIVLEADYLKIDAEGYEYFVLKGASALLEKSCPVVVIEENGLAERYGLEEGQAGNFLRDMGYKCVEKIKYDAIYSRFF